ncbi:kinase-like domain, phloem protein 2-like protein, partial [Tanacetum coccineum]
MAEGKWIDNPVKVKKEFFEHFANRFRKPDKSNTSLLADFPNQISSVQRSYLEGDVTNDEIKKAVWECGTDKAPGPDGFTFGFFRQFWYLVDKEVFEAVRYFFVHSDLPRGCNSSFIVLIPKFSDANLVKDFRPICLIGIIHILESIRSKFFNGHESSSKKATWVQWKKVLAPKENGGLGISSLYALNRGLMFKWVWRFLAHGSTLWSRIIKAIHGNDGNIDGVPKKGVCTVWTDIIGEIKILENKGINLLSFMKKDLGNGLSTMFWEEVWLEGCKLKDRFPRAYALDTCRLITVGHKLSHLSLTESFRRIPRDGIEKTQVDNLKALLLTVSLNDSQDKWNWDKSKSGIYSVASARMVIDSQSLPKGDIETRWIRYVPIKVNILAWKVMTNSLPTRFNISRRGIDIESLSCVNCDTGVETLNHLFFSCDMAKRVSQLIARWWDVPHIDIDSYGNWRSWIDNIKMPKSNKSMLEGVFYVTWWLLWNFRNKKIFEGHNNKKATFFDEGSVTYVSSGSESQFTKKTKSFLKDDLSHLKLSVEDISSATNNFDDENVLNEYGSIYKGRLLRSEQFIDIVVKGYQSDSEKDDSKMFRVELSMLSSLKHKNLVSLIGFVDEAGVNAKAIIYKREANGSLEKHLSDKTLTWMQRLKMCTDVANALSYIHYDVGRDFSVIHCNIKSSKILLDDKWEPKLSGFELSLKNTVARRHRLVLTRDINENAYLDPKYKKTGGLTHKSDVYSFGVVLLEVLSGRSAVLMDEELGEGLLNHLANSHLDGMIMPHLRKEMDTESLKIFSETAYWCIKEDRADRPYIDQVVKRLEKALELQWKHENPPSIQVK